MWPHAEFGPLDQLLDVRVAVPARHAAIDQIRLDQRNRVIRHPAGEGVGARDARQDRGQAAAAVVGTEPRAAAVAHAPLDALGRRHIDLAAFAVHRKFRIAVEQAQGAALLAECRVEPRVELRRLRHDDLVGVIEADDPKCVIGSDTAERWIEHRGQPIPILAFAGIDLGELVEIVLNEQTHAALACRAIGFEEKLGELFVGSELNDNLVRQPLVSS